MEHAEAREVLDLAAVEPGGLDRLMAGDTPIANSLAGHLAGCETCTAEFVRLRASSEVLSDVLATMPPPDLRERTLAFVAAVGRPRGMAAGGSAAADVPSAVALAAVVGNGATNGADPVLPSAADTAALAPVIPIATARPAIAPIAAQPRDMAATSTAPIPIASAPRSRRRRLQWIGYVAAAAALVIATAGTTAYIVSSNADASARDASAHIEALTEVASWTAQIDSEPDAQHVALAATAATTAPKQVGTLAFSSRAMQVVVVADGLASPPAGQEYGCWVEINGVRQRLGWMESNEGLAYWVGDASELVSVPAGSTFGVSLANVNGTGGPNPPILSGTLQAT